jgi:hypothetical protein
VFFSVQNQVAGGFTVGVRCEQSDFRITETEPGGVLANGVIPVSQAGTVSGAGMFIRYSLGFGLRYTFDKDERLNLRLDVGFGRDSTGMYITA